MSFKLKKNEDDVLEINKLLDSIIESSYDGIYVADGNGDGIIVNEAYKRITGVHEDELLGRNLKDVVNKGIISESVTLRVFKEKKPTTIVQIVKGKEVLVTGSPIFNEEGKITHVVTNVRDISELNKLKVELQEAKAYTKRILKEIDGFKKREDLKRLFDSVIAQSDKTNRALNLAKKIAVVDSTVILLGESGVGKEVFANIIHKGSKRSHKPYIKVNCGAIPPHLLESELFGYEKGAFTGADGRGKPGLFEQADGGTIFLDEIGETPLDLQVKLLRVLQEFEIMRIGGQKTKKIDVRVVCATNKNLEKMVERGEFREDLFYRLNIVPIQIPPLRERCEDIAPLAYYFLRKTNSKYNLNKKINPEVIYFMEQYHWPGNIREMENLIERIVVTTEKNEIQVTDLPPLIIHKRKVVKNNQSLKEIVEQTEKEVILEKISEYKTTRKTANELGISQSALVKKMKRLGLS
ncbi:sigma-54 interaction domain-containing protein [Alkalihalobacterium alkalinitrilicum]|uniref:sigma-54 interaction domain-containing protein n=1 Tax=Alkalihalobacterium alkalinitrilicum TaxID=427920 RepID=UPI00099530E2|nr:sigma 54-interacting transcriptional regulator [Alkalihalobacterium alkalinitrilicum]